MNRVIIGVGSNIQPEENIKKAKAILQQNYSILSESTFIQTKPVGFTDQPDFINGAWLIETTLSLSQLKDLLHQIENDLGRIRTFNKFGPRTIDLDALVWNGEIIDEDVFSRDFLRNAILEISPDLDIELST